MVNVEVNKAHGQFLSIEADYYYSIGGRWSAKTHEILSDRIDYALSHPGYKIAESRKVYSSIKPCWGINAVACDGIGPRELSMSAATAGYVEKIEALNLGGPVYLAGWSLGGMVAFEAALQLERLGHEVGAVVMIDSAGPPAEGQPNIEVFNPPDEMDFVRRHVAAYSEGTNLPAPDSCEAVWESVVQCLEKQGITAASLQTMLVREGFELFSLLDTMDLRRMIRCFNSIRSWDRARSLYVPSGTLAAAVHFIKAGRTAQDFSLQWQPFCEELIKLSVVQADHYSMLQTPGVSQVAIVVDDAAGSGSV